MFNLNNGGLFMYFFGKGGIFVGDPHFVLISNIYLLVALLVTIVSAYLLGSINSAIIISKLLYKDDIRTHGSGNPGMTNMLRTYGLGGAGLTLLGDVLKCVLAISVAGVLFGFNYIAGISMGDGYCYVAGMFAVFGHVFPVYYKFKGGKGVLATAAMALMLSPIPALLLLLVFVAMVAVSKYVSLGSVTGAVLYPVMVNAYFRFVFSTNEVTLGVPGLISLSTIIIAILIVWCHRENLKRISNRTERKISIGKKKKTDDDE